jgi:uncharacterized protein (DUF1501 family)
LSNTVFDLISINKAVAAQTNLTGYKALVCVFMNGGNDANNLIVPVGAADYASYAAIRGPTLALPAPDGTGATLQALTSKNGQVGYPAADGKSYGFNPAMIELAKLFNGTNATNQAKCAALLNVGTLSYPLTKAQYSAGSVPKPPQLFSHSDQQQQWQTSVPDQPQSSGWAGRVGDLFTLPTDQNAGGQISMAISLAGSNLFEVGNQNAAAQYSVSTSGATAISSVTGSRLGALQNILAVDKLLPDLQTAAYGSVLDHAINEAGIVNTALAGNLTQPFVVNNFPTNVVTPNGGSTFSSSLMSQLKMVARLIDLGSKSVAAGGLGMKRQVFFVQVGGYDTHTNQTNNTGASSTDNAKVVIGSQANLLAELSQSLNSFFQAMTDLSLHNSVTAFTVSDFARTFQPNGQGSDHGWGAHHVVVGGAVKGGATYGKLPALTINSIDDTGLGRWIPTTPVDQYAAALASWYGVDSNNLSTIFPNLGRFGPMAVPFI